MTVGSNSIADDILRNGYERWQRLEGEKQAISDDLKELFGELKGQGFDGKALRAAFRMVAKAGDVAVEEHNAMVDLYVDSLTAPRQSEVGTINATRRRAAREAQPDPIAALRADPAMAIVDVANIKKSEPQPAPAARDLINPPNPQGQVAPHPEAKASKDSGATGPTIEQPGDSVTGDASRASDGAGSVAPIQPETANEVPAQDSGGKELGESLLGKSNAARPASADAQPNGRGSAGEVGESVVTGGESAATKSGSDKSAEPPGSAAPASLYADPGIVTWEVAPPEPVKRHDYSYAFGDLGQDVAVIEDDLANAAAEPIVKIGCEILDGWARYMKARSMVGLDGRGMEYPVVQYDGDDPLMDCIRWNLAGRIMNDAQKRLVAQRLSKLQPRRKSDIYAAMELGMELVA